MDSEALKEQILRFNDEVWVKGNVAYADEFLSPQYTSIDHATGQRSNREEFKQFVATVCAQYSNLRLLIENLTVEDNRAAFLWQMTGNAADGSGLQVNGVSLYVLKDGKVLEDYNLSGPAPTI